MHPHLTQHLPALKRVFRENSVKKAYAFGSVCTDAFSEDSDVDILIDFEENLDLITYGVNYFKVVVEMEKILG